MDEKKTELTQIDLFAAAALCGLIVGTMYQEANGEAADGNLEELAWEYAESMIIESKNRRDAEARNKERENELP